MSPSLKFAPEPRETAEEAALAGIPAMTVRYALDEDIRAGQILTLTDTEGEPFGEAHVAMVPRCRAAVVFDQVPGVARRNYGYDTTAEMIEGLNTYYDDEIEAHTPVSPVVYVPRRDTFDL